MLSSNDLPLPSRFYTFIKNRPTSRPRIMRTHARIHARNQIIYDPKTTPAKHRKSTAKFAVLVCASWTRPLPKSKRQEPRKTRTSSAAYTDVREQLARSLTKEKAQPKLVALCCCRLNSASYLLENWGALRALCKPYFLRSLALGSRVRYPSFLRIALYASLSATQSARAMP